MSILLFNVSEYRLFFLDVLSKSLLMSLNVFNNPVYVLLLFYVSNKYS